jgi:hypothetical protein
MNAHLAQLAITIPALIGTLVTVALVAVAAFSVKYGA